MSGGRVPLVAYHCPGDPAVGDRVAAAITSAQSAGAPIRAVMLDRLGPNVWHSTLAQAMAALEELEETAKLWLLTRNASAPLSSGQMDELRQAFGACW